MSILTVCYEILQDMAILEILKYPDPALRKVAAPVKNVDRKVVELIDNMLETMYAAGGRVPAHHCHGCRP